MTGGSRGRPRFLDDLPVFDAHADTLSGVVDLGWDLAAIADSHIDLDKLRRGGVGTQVFVCWPEPELQPENRAAHRVLQMIDALHQQAERHADALAIARSVEEADAIRSSGRVAAFLGIEGGHAIESDLRVLRGFHRLGVRTMTITWSNHTGWADGCGEKHHVAACGGLSSFGRDVIGEMEALGMVVDVSHAAPATVEAVARCATRPFIASHSNARALCDHVRNLTDEQARLVTASGGVVCVTFVADFVRDTRAAFAALRASPEFQALPAEPVPRMDWMSASRRAFVLERLGRPSLDDVLAHVRHLVGVVGVDHVGVGSDFDGCPVVPHGLDDAADFASLAEALATEFGEAGARKILGANLRRVYRACMG